MTRKHTPGPWRFQASKQGAGPDQRYIITDNSQQIGSKQQRTGSAEGYANACLIAAAPALLAALKVMVLTPGILAHLEATDPMALEQARAAIAKAEGTPQAR